MKPDNTTIHFLLDSVCQPGFFYISPNDVCKTCRCGSDGFPTTECSMPTCFVPTCPPGLVVKRRPGVCCGHYCGAENEKGLFFIMLVIWESQQSSRHRAHLLIMKRQIPTKASNVFDVHINIQMIAKSAIRWPTRTLFTMFILFRHPNNA